MCLKIISVSHSSLAEKSHLKSGDTIVKVRGTWYVAERLLGNQPLEFSHSTVSAFRKRTANSMRKKIALTFEKIGRSHVHSCPQPKRSVRLGGGDDLLDQPVSLEKKDTEQRRSTKNLTRDCDEDCILPPFWGQRIYTAMKKLEPTGGLQKMKKAFLQLEYCRGCNPNSYPECMLGDNCRDIIKLLREVAPHWRGVRVLLRRIYKLRECLMWILRYDSACRLGQWEKFQQLLDVVTLPRHVREKLPKSNLAC